MTTEVTLFQVWVRIYKWKNDQSEHFFARYCWFRWNAMIIIETLSLYIATQVLLETSSKEKPCHLNGLLKIFLWYFFLLILNWKELTMTIGANRCVILSFQSLSEIAEITKMAEWKKVAFPLAQCKSSQWVGKWTVLCQAPYWQWEIWQENASVPWQVG